jgi:hypothetical protein
MSPRDRNYIILLPFSYFCNIFIMKRVKEIKKKLKHTILPS